MALVMTLTLHLTAKTNRLWIKSRARNAWITWIGPHTFPGLDPGANRRTCHPRHQRVNRKARWFTCRQLRYGVAVDTMVSVALVMVPQDFIPDRRKGLHRMNQIYIYLPGIFLAYAAFFLGIMSPGPNILAVIGTSMSIGRQEGSALALGVAIGSFCWATLTVIGLSALLAAYASALIVIKVVGGLYLLWLAYKAFKSAASAHDIEATTLEGARRTQIGYFVRGYAIQMTNPKAALSWIAIISLGLQQDAPLWVGIVIVAGTTILSVTFHLLYAIAFSTPLMVRLYSRARRWIQGTLGMFFAFAGFKLLTSRS